MFFRVRSSRLSLSCVLLLLSTFACAPGLVAQNFAPRHARHAKDQIAALEEQWRLATINGDAAAMDKLLSDDYVGISWTGQVNTKAMQLDRIRNRMVVVRSMDLTDVKIKVVQAIAIVTCRSEVESTSDGAESSGEFRYTRVYQRLPSGSWKITNFEATRIPANRHGPRGAGPPPPAS